MLTPAIFDALDRVPDEGVRTVSSGMRRLAVRGSLGATDIGGVAWIDVDTPQDHAAAERLVLARSHRVRQSPVA